MSYSYEEFKLYKYVNQKADKELVSSNCNLEALEKLKLEYEKISNNGVYFIEKIIVTPIESRIEKVEKDICDLKREIEKLKIRRKFDV